MLALLDCLKQVFFKAFKQNLAELVNFPFALRKCGRAKARVAPPLPRPLSYNNIIELSFPQNDFVLLFKKQVEGFKDHIL